MFRIFKIGMNFSLISHKLDGTFSHIIINYLNIYTEHFHINKIGIILYNMIIDINSIIYIMTYYDRDTEYIVIGYYNISYFIISIIQIFIFSYHDQSRSIILFFIRLR